MNIREYGDKQATLASLGGEGVIKSQEPDDWPIARQIIETYLDAGGVLIDTSPEYTQEGYERLSEKRLGEVLPQRDRSSFILCTKTEERTKDKALKDLEESLDTLGLRYVDEWRLHHLDTEDELDEIFADDGAIHAMDQAISEGLVLRSSISGHSDPDVLLEALDRYEFDSVLGAVNIADKFKHSFQEELIPYCKDNDVTFTGMKLCSRSLLFRKNGIESMQDAFNYTLSIPGVNTAIVGVKNMAQLGRLIECDEKFEELDDNAKEELEDKVEAYAIRALYFRKGETWPENVDELPELLY